MAPAYRRFQWLNPVAIKLALHLAVHEATQRACVQLDCVVRAHFVAAVADAFSFVDVDVRYLNDGDRVHRADATWYHGHKKAL